LMCIYTERSSTHVASVLSNGLWLVLGGKPSVASKFCKTGGRPFLSKLSQDWCLMLCDSCCKRHHWAIDLVLTFSDEQLSKVITSLRPQPASIPAALCCTAGARQCG